MEGPAEEDGSAYGVAFIIGEERDEGSDDGVVRWYLEDEELRERSLGFDVDALGVVPSGGRGVGGDDMVG
jgi:hypothetical protein